MGENGQPCKLAVKFKLNTDNRIDKYEPRLIDLGCRQTKFYYDKTFSRVIDFTTIRFALGVVAFEGAMVHNFDAASAFLYGTLGERIYMYQPRGFENPDMANHVCCPIKNK